MELDYHLADMDLTLQRIPTRSCGLTSGNTRNYSTTPQRLSILYIMLLFRHSAVYFSKDYIRRGFSAGRNLSIYGPVMMGPEKYEYTLL